MHWSGERLPKHNNLTLRIFASVQDDCDSGSDFVTELKKKKYIYILFGHLIKLRDKKTNNNKHNYEENCHFFSTSTFKQQRFKW